MKKNCDNFPYASIVWANMTPYITALLLHPATRGHKGVHNNIIQCKIKPIGPLRQEMGRGNSKRSYVSRGDPEWSVGDRKVYGDIGGGST